MSRIPDVGNPWLDAGIVSFSTLRYRAERDYWHNWYPAHWISESFPGQFRNWFYSLLAMATVLEGTPPFSTCFGYATLMAEDGRAMHKSWGNSIEFNEAADCMGADVMRWLYCSQRPENNLLFGYQRADEVRRQFLIPLWNVYHFFITYANLDGWAPEVDDIDPAMPEGPVPQSTHVLDTWLLARLHQVTARCTERLENSDTHAVTVSISEFLDDLSNWYIRRNRRRFWKGEQDSDKHSAYATLYHTLVKLIKLLAPMTPFVTEVMYQNLVRSVQPQAHDSVHHSRWPETQNVATEPAGLEQMALARQITSLGLSARSSANLKVRQPLATALVHIDGEAPHWTEAYTAIVTDELNVKDLAFVDEADTLRRFEVLPNRKLLGPRLGAMLPGVMAALEASDQTALSRRIHAGQPIVLDVDDQAVELAPEELIIRTHPAAGLALAADRGVTVAVRTELTPSLQAEGWARELVRRIQVMRKTAGFDLADRIATYVVADADLIDAVQTWAEYMKTETLSTTLEPVAPPESAYIEQHTIDIWPVTWLTDKSQPHYFSSRFLVLKAGTGLATHGILLFRCHSGFGVRFTA